MYIHLFIEICIQIKNTLQLINVQIICFFKPLLSSKLEGVEFLKLYS